MTTDLENVCVMGRIYPAVEKDALSSCICSIFSTMPVMIIAFWLNVYSVIKLFLFLFYFL